MSAQDKPIRLEYSNPVWGHQLEDMDGNSVAMTQFHPYQPKKGRRNYRESEVWVSTQHDRFERHLTPDQMAALDVFLADMARNNAQSLALWLAEQLERPLLTEEFSDAADSLDATDEENADV